MADKNKLPPQNLEAEQSVLGCLMMDRNSLVKVVDFLKAEDFYKGSHQKIYSAMLELFEKGEPIDILSVSNTLNEKDQLQEIGGQSYLTELINSVPNALHVKNYADTVKKKKILRDLIEASYQIGEMGHDEAKETDELVDEAEKCIFRIAQGSLKQKFTPIHTMLGEAFDRFDRISKHDGSIRGVTTGFKALDDKLSGLQKSDLIILAARPSLGKTSLALDIARNAAVKSKIPVGIFSLEMSTEQIVDRFIAAQAHVDLWKLRTGKLGKDDITKIQHALENLSGAPIFINDTPALNPIQMKAMARRLQAEHGLGLIVIDYLQLMDSNNKIASIVQQVSEMSRGLKILARELNVPILALSQLSRAVEQRIPPIPKLSDLRESGSLEQDADVVLFIYREKNKQGIFETNEAEIIIAKHRNGPVGKADLFFSQETASFGNLDRITQIPQDIQEEGFGFANYEEM
ncbi:MAG TPA: replicative DNA helicase [Candidatus Pacearchaeota archaeon]|nr:replicative DNA helicase [Candidatus Parcubacteria bacterium]HNZ84054.1 replicative DNA helicase [Candidatus Pacearchaeota archaeon]HOU45919.1 replicative DNA helicase [Candidatus Pacearchaeota archaeon]HPM08212.1 replicative DNA helicase [Candidatus Pacearchaeota archaeon]HQI74468.1 replicative DNA helicase [Candidatus Pacearchaeota archaeon]